MNHRSHVEDANARDINKSNYLSSAKRGKKKELMSHFLVTTTITLFSTFILINLTLSQTNFAFHVSADIVFIKTLWEKEKLLVTSNFSFSRSVFHPFGELSAIYFKLEIVVCKLFQFGRVYNLSFGKELITPTICTALYRTNPL